MAYAYLEPDEEDLRLFPGFMKKFGNGGFYWACHFQLGWAGPGLAPDSWFINLAAEHYKAFGWEYYYDYL